jgi:hypothetical protein
MTGHIRSSKGDALDASATRRNSESAFMSTTITVPENSVGFYAVDAITRSGTHATILKPCGR